MVKAGYFDCISGVSGDMILGALVDCGLSVDALESELAKLDIGGYVMAAGPASRGAINGTQVTVVMEGGGVQHRGLGDILSLIQGSSLGKRVKERSAGIFQRLAEAEARVHRVAVNEVRFHEVGATDAIVDVVGAVIALDFLGIEVLYSSPLPSGGGTADTLHGSIPVPAPAMLELIASSNAPIRPTPERGRELVTPTGAAIITTLASFDRPTIYLDRVGYGIGTRDDTQIPNVLPLWTGETAQEEGELLLLETNIDDMSPELCGYVMERLFERGALDVWFTPIQMKKNRPAVMLSVLISPAAEGAMVDTILRETTTFGLRVQRVERRTADRETMQFDSSLGRVALKLKRLHGEIAGTAPEYEDCRRIAIESGLPLQEVYRIVNAEGRAKLMEGDTSGQE